MKWEIQVSLYVFENEGKSLGGWELTQNPAGLPPHVGELVLSPSKGLRPPAPI